MLDETIDSVLLSTVYFSRLLRKHAKERGLRISAFSVLNNLEHWGKSLNDGHGGGVLTQKELADMEDVTQATMSSLVVDLTGEGLVTRTRSAKDKRSMDVRLTKKGSRYLLEEGIAMKRLISDVLGELPAQKLSKVHAGQTILATLLRQSGNVQNEMNRRAR